MAIAISCHYRRTFRRKVQRQQLISRWGEMRLPGRPLFLPQEFLVDVAPSPIFAGFERADERVLARVEVFRRVLVFRRVAAANVAAAQAEAKVDPGVALVEAFLAHVLLGFRDRDLIEVGALGGHAFLRF
jgi:hypothetical protein